MKFLQGAAALVLCVAVASTGAAQQVHDHSGDLSSLCRAAMIQKSAGKTAEAQALAAKALKQAKPSEISSQEFVTLANTLEAVNSGQLKDILAAWQGRLKSDQAFMQSSSLSHLASLAQMLKTAGQTELLKELAAMVSLRLDKAGASLGTNQLQQAHRIAQLASDDSLSKKTAKLAIASISANGQFRGDIVPAEIGQVTSVLASIANNEDIGRLGDYVATEYLSQEGLLEALRGVEWQQILAVIQQHASAQAKAKAARLIGDKLKAGQLDVSRMSPALLAEVAKVADLAGQEQASSQLAARWLGVESSWQAMKEQTQKELTAACWATEEKRQATATSLMDRFAKGELPSADAAGAMALAARTPLPRQAAVLEAVYGSLAKTKQDGPALLEQSVRFIAASGSKPGDAQARALLDAASVFADRPFMISSACWRSLAGLLAGQLDAVTAKTGLADGKCNLAGCRILAEIWSIRQRPEYAYDRFKSKAAATEGDVQARWSLAMSYAVAQLPTAGTRGVMRQMDAAMASAKTAEMKVLCFGEMMARAAGTDGVPQVLQAIKSVEGQFEGSAKAELQVIANMASQRADLSAPASRASLRWRDRFDNAQARMNRGSAVGIR